jgi:hypothetical protein
VVDLGEQPREPLPHADQHARLGLRLLGEERVDALRAGGVGVDGVQQGVDLLGHAVQRGGRGRDRGADPVARGRGGVYAHGDLRCERGSVRGRQRRRRLGVAHRDEPGPAQRRHGRQPDGVRQHAGHDEPDRQGHVQRLCQRVPQAIRAARRTS